MYGWGEIEFNWSKDSKFIMYGCNSGRDDTLFAQRISLLSNFTLDPLEFYCFSHTKFCKEVEDGFKSSFSSGKNSRYKG